jgi:hypothetical protein
MPKNKGIDAFYPIGTNSVKSTDCHLLSACAEFI